MMNLKLMVRPILFVADKLQDKKFLASQHLKNKLPELIRSYTGNINVNFCNFDFFKVMSIRCVCVFALLVDLSSGLEGGFGDLAIEVLHVLLSHLILHSEEEIGVSSVNVETFVETLRRDFPRERVPVVLAPLLYREQQDITEDRCVNQIILQLGYAKFDMSMELGT